MTSAVPVLRAAARWAVQYGDGSVAMGVAVRVMADHGCWELTREQARKLVVQARRQRRAS